MVDPRIGTTVSHYRIIERLGAGAMGVVYRAHDIDLDRLVALKFLTSRGEGSDEPDRTAEPRFVAEARAVSAVDHPNVGAVYEIDRSDDGQLFIAMAHYEGETLKERLARDPLSWDEAADVGVQLADALEAAHTHGVVHRDVKPANVIVTHGGVAKLIDFGIARSALATDLTRTGQSLGTVAYMSPEQARGERVDSRSDIWSLGVVLYEMLVGRPPFSQRHPVAVLHSILEEAPPPVPGPPGIPGAMKEIIDGCVSPRTEGLGFRLPER